MKVVSKREELKRYRCQKHTFEGEGESYDKTTIQKLTEIFDFEYLARKKTAYVTQSLGSNVSDSPSSDRICSQCSWDSNSDDFQYTPLETFRSDSYPLSLPPPRSDDDIQPVSSRRRQQESRPLQECVSAIINAERRLLLHDLFSGDIYES